MIEHPNIKADCVFCVMFARQVPPGTRPFLPEDVCGLHREMSGIPEYIAAHPDGQCSDGCGCQRVNLTYLARGIIKPL